MKYRYHVTIAGLLASVAPGQVSVATIFSENSVVQRDAPITVWGKAAAGENVTVRFAGQTKSIAAGRYGRWLVMLDPVAGSNTPKAMSIQGTSNTIELKRVFVGDVFVYLVMSFHLKNQGELFESMPHSDSLPPICMFRPTDLWEHKNHRHRPHEEFSSRPNNAWKVYETPGKYYANSAFYFGATLGQETHLPVGIMGLAASELDTLIPPEGFIAHEQELGDYATEVGSWSTRTAAGKEAYLEALTKIETWAAKSRARLQSGDVGFMDMTQPPKLPGAKPFVRQPTSMYNFVIHRLTNMTVRSIIIEPWEFSATDTRYEAKARALIGGLRKVFGQKEIPVCFMQMESPDRHVDAKVKDHRTWVNLRAAQGRLTTLPKVDVIATYDLWQPKEDVHALTSIRAARWAAGLIKGTTKTGPAYESHSIRDNAARVVWKTEADLTSDGPLRGFELAGTDGKWHSATATIHGTSVVVTSDEVRDPKAVRYASTWAPKQANLRSTAGLAALPFEHE